MNNLEKFWNFGGKISFYKNNKENGRIWQHNKLLRNNDLGNDLSLRKILFLLNALTTGSV